MHPTTARVAAALRDAGFSAEIRTFEADTRTAQQAADALDVPLGAIVKSLCFMADDAPVMVLVSGANRGDPQKIRQVLGAARVVRANADDVRTATGYAIGGVPPLGHAKPMRIIIDPDLLQYDVLWAAAGTPNSVFRTTPAELERMTRGEVASIAEEATT
jgi:prolyl-tRNA editing enzyme YbaK/EbsC (Cys-tRNA(Pro) deacylase)